MLNDIENYVTISVKKGILKNYVTNSVKKINNIHKNYAASLTVWESMKRIYCKTLCTGKGF